MPLSTNSPSSIDSALIMRSVIIALVPATLGLWFYFGWGILHNLCWAIISAYSIEALCLAARQRPILSHLRDHSALVTACLVAVSVPAGLPAWQLCIGLLFGIGITKHLYGGLGSNTFNPAMVTYAVLLVAFPVDMSQWGHTDSIIAVADDSTHATPLDILKNADKLGLATPQIDWQNLFVWINALFLVGGLYLLYRKHIQWPIPVSVLLGLFIPASVLYAINSEHGHPLFHLLHGATMMGAFFIATDPVTAATSVKGRILYGAGIGCLVYAIRVWGHYPDAFAFAVLLMNTATPIIDYYTQPRVYGHQQSTHGFIKRRS